ncbi:MAG: phosphoribosylglycinamide synthetase C domain-containing protein, partial [Steroidobacteraceae bacterium]
VVLAADGYQDKVRGDDRIDGLDAAAALPGKVFHAGTRQAGNEVVTSGGRVLCAVGLGRKVIDAQQQAYQLVNQIRYRGMQYRRDIGHQAIMRERRAAPDDHG